MGQGEGYARQADMKDRMKLYIRFQFNSSILLAIRKRPALDSWVVGLRKV